jgi:hypothetical protein
MAAKSDAGKVKELAGGWITEREGTGVPLFLKLTYVGFSLFGLAYLFLYREGEVAHETRGVFVREVNKVMEVPGAGWFAFIGIVLVTFIVGLLWFAFRSDEGEE